MKVAAILAAAGAGRRLGAGRPKALVRVGSKTILRHAFDALAGAWDFEEYVVTAPPGGCAAIRRALGAHRRRLQVVDGGKTRAHSVHKALQSVSPGIDWVLIHDAARPLVSAQTVRGVLRAARRSGAALAAVPVSSTVKKAAQGVVLATVDRKSLVLAQTPQVFRKDLLLKRFEKLGDRAWKATDDAALFDGTHTRVCVVEDDPLNFKITTKGDLDLFRYYAGRAVR